MNKNQWAEVVEVLGQEAKPYHFFPEKYAWDHLNRVTQGQPKKVNALRKEGYGWLLQKPEVKKRMAEFPDGIIDPAQGYSQYPKVSLHVNSTLSKWGTERAGYRKDFQLSRTGYHLVLQMNVARSLSLAYRKKVQYRDHLPNYFTHPVSKQWDTLAWARLDFDLEGQSVLIEEVQSDMVREMRWIERKSQNKRYSASSEERQLGNRMKLFLDHDFWAYEQYWQECLMALVIQFIDQELGFRSAFMHQWASGCAIKGIQLHMGPPKSLYSRLPKRMGFRKTDERPDCLYNLGSKKDHVLEATLAKSSWWKLSW